MLGEVLDAFDPRAFRLLVLQTHYRRQMEVGQKELADAEKAVERLDALMRRARRAGLAGKVGDTTAFRDAMDDDFDTPAAIALIFEMVRDANTALDENRTVDAAGLVATIGELWQVLGLWWVDEDEELDGDIRALVTARDDARARKDWAESDRIRDELKAKGIVLEDTADGTVWRRLRADDEA
jgi:cysteinyl-tRNA synthetase